MFRRVTRLLSIACIAVGAPAATCQEQSPEKDRLIVETILRLESFNYETASEKVTSAVKRFLAANSGSDEFYSLIGRYELVDQKAALIRIAEDDANVDSGRALQVLLELQALDAIKEAIDDANGTPAKRQHLLKGLVMTGRPDALELAVGVVSGEAAVPVRIAATKALGANKAGEQRLLALATGGKLPADLSVTAAGVLNASIDEGIRTEAAKHLAMPASIDSKPLPPLNVLVERRGDPTKGKEVYQRICFVCHQIGDAGINFGPALTEIGDKLAREALYSSILEPSAAISFGFEGNEFELDDGTLLVGFVASETNDEFVVRVPGGISSTFPKAKIARRTKLDISLMPASLQSAMTADNLVDLVEYLVGLQK